MKNHSSRCYRFVLRQTLLEKAQTDTQWQLTRDSEEQIFFQLQNVLRVKVGDRLDLLNPVVRSGKSENQIQHWEVINQEKKAINLRFISQEHFLESGNQYGLAVALPKNNDKLALIIQKAVELNAAKIILWQGDFSNYSHQLNHRRLQEIIIEAVEQSENPFLPELITFSSLESYWQHFPENNYVALERSSSAQNLMFVSPAPNSQIVIGPEGGFSPKEKQLLQRQELTNINLGSSILRMETACILACGVFHLKNSISSS